MLRTALLLGGTGETGKQVQKHFNMLNVLDKFFLKSLNNTFSQLLKQLAADPSYNKVISVGRRKVLSLFVSNISQSSKLLQDRIDC